ncbi:MAG: hypothetical protein EOL97_07165 [Spirochaetia bacterium]|nr:hypothetical protein [Spirochaetia bacterium]
MATKSLLNRGTYDQSTQTYTDPSGQKYSMTESAAKSKGAVIINPILTNKKSSSSKKGEYIQEAQTYVSPTGELQSMSPTAARESGARIYGTTREYQETKTKEYEEYKKKLQEQTLPDVVSQQFEQELQQQQAKLTPTVTGKLYQTTDLKGNIRYTPISGTISTTQTPISIPTTPEMQKLFDTLRNAGFGFILQKDFYLPTQNDKDKFRENLTSGVFGNLAKLQEESLKNYERDQQAYARTYIAYVNNPTQDNINRLNLLGERLNTGLNSGNATIKKNFDADKLLQSYRRAGIIQKYGTEYLAQDVLSLGLGSISTTLGIGGKAALTAEKAARIRTTTALLGLGEGVAYGYGTYKRTGDIEEAIIAGVGESLMVGLPTYIDVNSALKFRLAMDDLRKSSAVLQGSDVIKTADGKLVLQSVVDRSGETLRQNVITKIIIDPNTNKVIYGTADSTILNIKTGRIVSKNNYAITDVFTKKLNSIILGMEKYGAVVNFVDLTNLDTYTSGIVSYTTNVMDKQYSFFDKSIKEYLNINFKDGSVTTSAEDIRNLGVSSRNIINENILSSTDFMPSFDKLLLNTKAGKVSDMIAFPSTVPPISPKVKTTTTAVSDLLTIKTTSSPLDLGLLTSSSAAYATLDVTPQVFDASMLLVNPAFATIQKGKAQTKTQTKITPVSALGMDINFQNLLFTPTTTTQKPTTITKTKTTQTIKVTQQQPSKMIQENFNKNLIMRPKPIQKNVNLFNQALVNPNILTPTPTGATGISGFKVPQFGFDDILTGKKKKKGRKGETTAFPTLFQSQIIGERKARYPGKAYTGFELFR